MRYFRKLDLFGHDYNFESEGSSKFSTIEGALFSLIAITTITVISFIFGQELYKRKSPNVSMSNDLLKDSEIDLKSFPVLMGFHDIYAREIKNVTDYIDFEIFELLL